MTQVYRDIHTRTNQPWLLYPPFEWVKESCVALCIALASRGFKVAMEVDEPNERIVVTSDADYVVHQHLYGPIARRVQLECMNLNTTIN